MINKFYKYVNSKVSMKSKKASKNTINIVVMLIIGLVIFSLGLGLFSQIAEGSNEELADLSDRN